MQYTIRKASLSDAEALNVISEQELGYPCPIEQTELGLNTALNKEYECVFVADDGEKAVGYVHACDYCLIFSEPMVNILGLAVDSRFARQGIGKALMQAAEKWAKSRGAKGIRLVSGETRHDAHAFYEKCGYKSTKNQKNFKKLF